jgi:hypothetical protein
MIEALRKFLIDADAADWTTVAAYMLAAALSVRADVHAGTAREPRERLFWRATAALLSFLGLNDLLDLQMLLTTIGREHAIANG